MPLKCTFNSLGDTALSRPSSFDPSILITPFYNENHRELASQLDEWCQTKASEWTLLDRRDADVGRQLVQALGAAGWFSHMNQHGHAAPMDFRSMGLRRQAFAYAEDLVDYAYSIQELAAITIMLYGSSEQKDRYLPGLANGTLVGAFAISELEAGSDVANIQMAARQEGDSYVLNGSKAWIAQGNVADICVVIARTGGGPGALGLSAFVVETNKPGFQASAIDVIAPRPWAHLDFVDYRTPQSSILGEPGQGFIIAVDVLERFRMTVASAALGFSRRAMDAALARALSRKAYRGTLFDLQLVKAKLAVMEVKLSAGALLTARSAWAIDNTQGYVRHSAVAKYYTTEAAGQIVDETVQIFGASGIVEGCEVERLHRQVRSLRIYEGASEVLLMNIAGELGAQSAHR